MVLRDIKIIDVKRSTFDKEKSDPAKGKYVWMKKVFIDYKSPEIRPNFRFSWNRNHEWSIADWQNKWPGCTFVMPTDNYVPAGISPNADNRYIFKDVVLMKIPVEEYISQRKKEIMESEKRPAIIKGMLRDEYRNLGVSVSDADLEKMSP